MRTNLLMDFSVDHANKKINVTRAFAAPLAKVWAAWTQSELLEQWFAPKPWRAKTKSMDFRPGGFWLYAMVGPDGSEHWARADYKSIQEMNSFTVYDAFCDPEGNINTALPRSLWTNKFTEDAGKTIVTMEIAYDTLEDLEQIIALGFKEGFIAAMENLDALYSDNKI